jgi:hypothetical protein
MSKKLSMHADLPASPLARTLPTAQAREAASPETACTVAPGDILRLEHANAYCKRGKYVVLTLDTTVCLALTKKKAKQRRITNHLVYVQITDLCFFKRTRKRLDGMPPVAPPRQRGSY